MYDYVLFNILVNIYYNYGFSVFLNVVHFVYENYDNLISDVKNKLERETGIEPVLMEGDLNEKC